MIFQSFVYFFSYVQLFCWLEFAEKLLFVTEKTTLLCKSCNSLVIKSENCEKYSVLETSG